MSSKCRLCGVRNPPGVRLFGVSTPKRGAKNQYYCSFCWQTIRQRAAESFPALSKTAESVREKSAYAEQMGVMLGLRKGHVDRGDFAAKTKKFLQFELPTTCIVNSVPLGAFYPTGQELEKHIEEARRRLTPVGWE